VATETEVRRAPTCSDTKTTGEGARGTVTMHEDETERRKGGRIGGGRETTGLRG